MLTTLLAALVLTAPSALAEDGGGDSPEFLMGDLGVRLDLSRTWRMTRWSDWDFQAEATVGRDKLLLFVWATPVQVPITEPVDGWGAVYNAKVDELRGFEPKITGVRLATHGKHTAAEVDAAFTFGEGGPSGVLRGATVEVAGQNMHIAVVCPEKVADRASKELASIVTGLDFQGDVPALEFGALVRASGIATTLPDGWRPPLESEMTLVNPVVGKLGIDDLEACWTAIHPRAGGQVDVMATCQGGLLLGVVDEHSFAAVDPVIRAKMFGAVEIPAAEKVELADRVGFAYAVREGLAVGVVPYDKGVARTWVVGEGDLSGAAEAAMMGSTYSGQHPAGFGDMASYWLVHRTTSPVVLCPLGGLLCVGGGFGLGVMALLLRGRGRNKYADFDDD